MTKLDEAALREVFAALSAGRFAKEAVPDVLALKAKGRTVDQAVKELGISMVSSDEAAAIVGRVVKEREAFVREKGKGAVGPLMGVVMAELKGKLDGKAASELLRKEIEKLLSS